MRPALHAEWTKLRTIASTGRLLLASIALTVALGTVIVLAVSLCTNSTVDKSGARTVD
jgi:ABC-2 type transport system permease protein